ncbi:MAG: TetR/AcrR family transcriptional regulator [Coriobacteriales bacterium]|jgi:AcrR family transcriptional regulator|nr:TetR/AcrR family transcriptional regulator [Coriobacteriales bacterium]
MAPDKETVAYFQPGTKRRIIMAAIELFAAKGYGGASMRDIAKAVDIKTASIYSHFESKEALLYTIYDAYEFHLAEVLPDMDKLLAELEHEDPRNVLMKSTYYFSPNIQKFMGQTVAVAVYEARTDARSEEFVNKVLLEIPGSITKRLLNRLLELEYIEPLDVDAMVVLLTNYCYSAAVRDNGMHPIGIDDWVKGYTLLTTLIQPTEKGLAAASLSKQGGPTGAR